MNIGFWDNSLSERGTTISLFDYAFYNQKILNNNSYIFYNKNEETNNNGVINKFKREFNVCDLDDFFEIDEYIKIFGITHLYIIKYGNNDNKLSKIAKNCIHCVFEASDPHGDVYSIISPTVLNNRGLYPVVPHMINIPKHNENMREILGIPNDAVVFGGYGGKTSFDIGLVHYVIYNVALMYPKIYFIFANFERFCPILPNIIHLPTIVNLNEKVAFINTTDAMIWGRSGGETFGISIGEFSTLNKPIICTPVKIITEDGIEIYNNNHIDILGDKAIIYSDEVTLFNILVNFDPNLERNKDWNAYKEYTPEKVMEIFKKVYLD